MNEVWSPWEDEVDIAFIADHLDDPSIRIVEIDVSPAGYKTGHIPGAVLWDAYVDLRRPDYSLVDRGALEELVRRSGISSDTIVVASGYGAHLGYWLLRSVGHERVRLLDGSRERWTRSGHEWSTDVPRFEPTSYELGPQELFIASEEAVRSMAGSTSGVILDVRSDAEYAGVNFWPSGAPESVGRPGHVPGAVHLPVETLRTSDGEFVDVDVIEQAVRDHGLDRSAEIITYCTIGNRASQAWYALTVMLGFENVRVYYGSWVEWGMESDSAIEP